MNPMLNTLQEKQPSFEEPTTKEEAVKAISALTTYAEEVIKAAENISEKFKISFGFSLAYGMGGTYYPESASDEDDGWSSSDTGWMSSSSQC